MAIVLARQFERLREIAESAESFIFISGQEYDGVIRPCGIVRQNHAPTGESTLFLILAEDVPAGARSRYLVGARLTHAYEFESWEPRTKTLGGIENVNMFSKVGTMDRVCAEESFGGITCTKEWPI